MSGGQIIAQCLTHAGFRCVTREDLIAAMNRAGELANQITTALETAAQDYEAFTALRRPYKILMRRALLDCVKGGDLAYFGYSGHLLVEGISHFVRVRLLAPLDLRIRTTVQRQRCTEEQAREYIRRFDAERARWARFVYGKDMRDPRLYDFCVNTEKFTFPAVCSLLVRLLEEKELLPTEESMAALGRLDLASRIEAALVVAPETHKYEIAAIIGPDESRLEGPYLDDDELAKVRAVVRSVPGAPDLPYVPGYSPDLEFTS
jgi:cytidylate kinase